MDVAAADADAVYERVRRGGLLEVGVPVVALLSGGRDSVCLLDVAARLLGTEAVTALHVNYGLRDDSDADQEHCVELCRKLGVEIAIERPRRPEGPGNLQAWARDARYAAAARIALGQKGAIATGHTADDQVETILYRLASSPSRRALLGMKPRDGSLLRPLLGVTREQTTEYCEARGLRWRDDPSNDQGSYARNRVRHGLATALAEVHPAAAQNVLRTAELLRDEGEVLDALVDAELDGSGAAPRGEIAIGRLAELPPALRRLVVQRLADRAFGRPVPGAANHADEVADLTRGGSALDLGSNVQAVLRNGVVRARVRE
jgi:tRNA(Ile)-lysidine synthase